MKRFFITLAALMMIVPAINAQKSNTAKALKELAKAQENLNKKNDASAWLKYGTALLYAYEAPVDGLSTGMDANNVAIMTKGHIRLSSEQTEINGKQYVVNKYSDKELYMAPNGTLSAYKIIKSPIEGEDALAKSLEAFQKAKEMGASVKDLAPIMQSLARRHWSNAISAYNLGDYKEASSSFEKCYDITADPVVNQIDTNAIIYAGISSVLGKDPQRAISLFEKVRQIPGAADGDIYANLADSYKMTGDTAKCKAVLAEGFEKFPTNQGVLVSLINVYLETNDDPQKIISVIHKAQENEPTNASLVYAEGNLHRNMKDYQKAIELYRKAAELDPKYVYAPFNEGDTYYQMALDIQDKASAEPDDAKYNELAAQLNDCLKKAIEPFERAFSITDDIEIKKGCAEYLKQIFFRFRDEDPQYQANYDKYKKFSDEASAPAE
ncbi:MAG: tetratricopeptide repeat protein [Bacteroidales bacterium]|nr:tetratricopeptide repeat protein [Bacteroidales bacterium]MBQ2483655.1 tetratricopeptide repeat protein [Bacteroidales bacterium]MBQ2493493.1 tetratricopeptide repeat protein [Bacteroidales bacterium]MBQ4196344.1 tetratricopeptide repeat protein [Bacteroidales bacterium]